MTMSAKRLLNIAFAIGGTAALTLTLLALFQESADSATKNNHSSSNTKSKSKHNVVDDDSPAENPAVKPANLKEQEEATRILEEPYTSIGLKRVGDGTMLFPDYIGGLMTMSKAAAAELHGIGFINNFGQCIALVTRPEHAKKILSQHIAHDLGGMTAASASYFGDKVLFILEGPEWKRLRHIMLHAFLPRESSDVTSVGMQLSARLAELADTGKLVDMHFVSSMFHLSAIGKFAFGYDLECIDRISEGPNKIIESFEYLLSELPRRAFSPDANIREDYVSDNEDNIQWRMHAKNVRDVVMEMVTKRMADRVTGVESRRDLLDAMIASYEKNLETGADKNLSAITSQELTDALGDNLMELIFAGYNTVSAVLGNCVYYIAKDKDLQARVQNEADAALAGLEAKEAIDLKKLPLCEAVFFEALRLATPVPLVYRTARTPTELDTGNGGKITLPPTNIWIPAIFIQTNSDVWGPDAAVFNPDRWLKNKPPHPPGAFLAFSSGPRDCIGKTFARLEGLTALACMFKDFTFTIPEDYQFSPTFTGFGLRPFDARTHTVCVNAYVEKRINSETMYDWSLGPNAVKQKTNS